MTAFLERQQQELDHDHLKDIARSFQERARMDETVPVYEDAASRTKGPTTFTAGLFTGERMKHIAGDQKIWMLPKKVRS